MSRGEAALTLLMALGMAVALFVAAPHVLALLMNRLGAGGDMQGFSFHLWDGLFKLALFRGYIAVIPVMPEIRRVFQYHGAEHKSVHAFENGGIVTLAYAEPCADKSAALKREAALKQLPKAEKEALAAAWAAATRSTSWSMTARHMLSRYMTDFSNMA